jgi:general secretion pathway protein N
MNTTLGWRSALLLGMSGLLTGLLLMAPASLLVHWMGGGDPPPVAQLIGVSGELREGQAAALSINGRPALRDLQWDLRPAWLLLANLSAGVRAQADDSLLQADVSVWPGKRLRASEVQFSGSIKSLLAAAGQPFVPIDGMARIADGRIALKDGWPSGADARVEIRDLAWTLAATPVVLGDFEIVISDADDGIRARFSALSGPLEVNGEALLKADRSYQLDLGMKPKPEASPVLRNLLASNGAPDAGGWYHLRQQRQAPTP